MAVLVAHAGRTVSVPRIVDAVWDESPPATADHQVRNMVGRLRRALSPGPQRPSPIRADGPGCLLATDGVRVDAQELTARVDAAARAGTDGVPLLREAPWTCGAARPWTACRAARPPPVAAGLEEQRMAALERLFELELAAGRHDRTVPELIGLVEATLRGGLVRHLLTALLRAGRSTGPRTGGTRPASRGSRALTRRPNSASSSRSCWDPARRGRSRPVSPRCRGGHGGRSTAALPRPAQLPWESPAFVGREAQLRARRTRPGRPRGPGGRPAAVALITGAAGAGKSTLALRWAHRTRDRFPDGRLFTDLHGWSSTGPQHPQAVLGSFLRALGVPVEGIPAQIGETAALYRSTLAGRRVLIVLDNALDAAQVRPLLPGAGDAAGSAGPSHRHPSNKIRNAEGIRRTRHRRVRLRAAGDTAAELHRWVRAQRAGWAAGRDTSASRACAPSEPRCPGPGAQAGWSSNRNASTIVRAMRSPSSR
ncbi:winged helix-turn-helix domain-containing protein [Kitasatospora sp. NPDC057940]|uniref:AfsR/SARP family transcriptional regulator n=1 Tax=Kitasatospora sp. NPDC057940 TaxID=3346285 RepID=UPI0036DCA445